MEKVEEHGQRKRLWAASVPGPHISEHWVHDPSKIARFVVQLVKNPPASFFYAENVLKSLALPHCGAYSATPDP